MATPQRVVLVFAGARVDVDLPSFDRRGSLRMLSRHAEEHFGLCPGKYSFIGAQGKIDSAEALKLVAQEVVDGECVIQISEHSDGKIMREMYWAMHTMETRLNAKMEEAILNVQQELGAMVVDVARDQVRLREKVDEVIDEALVSRTDLLEGQDDINARLEGLDELRSKLEGLELDCLAMRADALEGEHILNTRLDELTAYTSFTTSGAVMNVANATADDKLSSSQLPRDKAIIEAEASMYFATTSGNEARSEESLQCELQQELALQVSKGLNDIEQDDISTICTEVHALGNQLRPSTSAFAKDLSDAVSVNRDAAADAPAPPKTDFSPPPPKADFPLQGVPFKSIFAKGSVDSWSTSYSSQAIPYSSKSMEFSNALKNYSTKKTWQIDPAASFAQVSGTPGLRTCRSSPVLPPLK
jgi:hypothetical protein